MPLPKTAPVLSTPDSHIFEGASTTSAKAAFPSLRGDDDVDRIYEISRTASEILSGGWRNVALQFPDHMLKDAPRVYERLSSCLHSLDANNTNTLCRSKPGADDTAEAVGGLSSTFSHQKERSRAFRLTILADTSYGACCVDEIAAEHVDADVVVHYGRTCLSPTTRLPVIYVYTLMPLSHDAVVDAIKAAHPISTTKIMILADVPYQGHVRNIADRLETVGYSNVCVPAVVHDPSSLIPNRTIPPKVLDGSENLEDFAAVHIAEPPPALLLSLSAIVKSVHIISVSTSDSADDVQAVEASTTQSLRRRYALVAKLSTVPIFGILINTLSVKNYMDVLQHVKDLITSAGKKYYTFVVGKVNAAKVANFSEVEGWVVIGCWESSLIDSKDFWKPIITPYELKLALTDETERIWTGKWSSDFQQLLNEEKDKLQKDMEEKATFQGHEDGQKSNDQDDGNDEESEPPVFDLRTGRYVSQSRPMARTTAQNGSQRSNGKSSALVKRAGQELAQIGGEVSPAAEFLRSNRTWRGLGSDATIEYQYDTDGKLQGAQMEQGCSGIARGYAVGDDASKS